MKSLAELQDQWVREAVTIQILSDQMAALQLQIKQAWDDIEATNLAFSSHPDAPTDDERFENHREPEDRIWSAMQGGTDGG